MSEFRRRLMMALVPSVKPRTLKGRGRISWQGAYPADLLRVVVRGEEKQEGIPGIDAPVEPIFLEGVSLTDGMNTVQLPVLRALPDGSVRDEMDAVSGTVTRRIKELVLDGRLNWRVYNPSSGWKGFMLINFLPNIESWAAYVCNQLPPKQSGGAPEGEGTQLWIGTKDKCLYYAGKGRTPYYNDALPDKGLRNWKNYLRRQPLKVWYVLTAPITEQYDPVILRQHSGNSQLSLQGGFREAEIEADVYQVLP